nr:hypothetical protein [Vibrio vulnificus]
MFELPNQQNIVFHGERKIFLTCAISAIHAFKLIRSGYQAYLSHVININSLEMKLEDVPIANEFVDVFPSNLLGLPPDRDIEFSIE